MAGSLVVGSFEPLMEGGATAFRHGLTRSGHSRSSRSNLMRALMDEFGPVQVSRTSCEQLVELKGPGARSLEEASDPLELRVAS